MFILMLCRMFTSLTTLPTQLALPPYSLTPSIIGVTYLPVGVAMLFGARIGGQLSDIAAVKFSTSPDGRLVYSLLGLALVPVGCIGYGYTLGYGTNLAGPLITQSIVGFGQVAQYLLHISFALFYYCFLFSFFLPFLSFFFINARY